MPGKSVLQTYAHWLPEEEVREVVGTILRASHTLVIGFELEEDAHKVFEVLPKRFSKYGLTIHLRIWNVASEEPDALIGYVRIYGGRGALRLLGAASAWRTGIALSGLWGFYGK